MCHLVVRCVFGRTLVKQHPFGVGAKNDTDGRPTYYHQPLCRFSVFSEYVFSDLVAAALHVALRCARGLVVMRSQHLSVPPPLPPPMPQTLPRTLTTDRPSSSCRALFKGSISSTVSLSSVTRKPGCTCDVLHLDAARKRTEDTCGCDSRAPSAGTHREHMRAFRTLLVERMTSTCLCATCMRHTCGPCGGSSLSCASRHTAMFQNCYPC